MGDAPRNVTLDTHLPSSLTLQQPDVHGGLCPLMAAQRAPRLGTLPVPFILACSCVTRDHSELRVTSVVHISK